MNDTSPKTGSGSTAAGLMLRVTYANGQTDEMYVAKGLSIGRSQANTIRLADDAGVERNHAQVVPGANGGMKLTCLGMSAFLSLGSTTVKELGLAEGIQFRIGRTLFECVQGLLQPFVEKTTALAACCPHCSADGFAKSPAGVGTCLACSQRVLVLRNIPGLSSTVVVPEQFGQYRATQFVARGGMGLVLQGVGLQGKRLVAIKILLPDKSISRSAAERFKQEIAAMKRVRSPEVVNLLGYGRAGRFNFLVMDWIQGKTLREVIAQSVRDRRLIDYKQALPWIEQLCKGLAAIHTVGVVHRDIKPSNILIDTDGRARISDLGIAKNADAYGTSLTMTGEMPGTLEYMAPEQIAAPDTADQRTDLYSLGVTIYEMLTGARPVGAWKPASQLNPTVPVAFDTILSRLLQRSPADRFADMYQLQVAIMLAEKQKNGFPENSSIDQLKTTTFASPRLEKRNRGRHMTLNRFKWSVFWISLVVIPALVEFGGWNFWNLFFGLWIWILAVSLLESYLHEPYAVFYDADDVAQSLAKYRRRRKK